MKLSTALCFALLLFCTQRVLASVTVEKLTRPGAVEILITDESISLAPTAIIEKQTQSGWIVVARDIVLTASCQDDELNGCRQLPVGTKLRPVPWTGLSCSGQCNQHCKKNVYVGSGTFRLTFFSCNRALQFHSAPFQMPDRPDT